MAHPSETNREKRPNRLIFEKSPYLLQHAYNPVDWYPWGEEAFAKAKKENKPIFLSIGYSTCHWCHVMERESFEDIEVAKLLNDTFVCIKVDREERPDIDSIYMTVCQIMTGAGGWPLSIIMTPEKEPFFAATYIPRETLFVRLGMKELIPKIKALWTSHQDEVVGSAKHVTTLLRQIESPISSDKLGKITLQEAYQSLSDMFDGRYGGFGSAPKFPTSHQLTFLLRYWRRTGKEKALFMVEKTLQAMRLGGIYDHIGFGFHRYSTDARWLVPHFEKMLYDQALLSLVYTEAYQATGKEEYGQAVSEMITYLLRDMTSPEGGFYSAEDAESESEEGKFYLWTEEQIRSTLLEGEAELLIKVFNITPDGNFKDVTGKKTGENILHLKKNLTEMASDLKMPVEELQGHLEHMCQKLFVARERRIHPAKDDKILTDWNGLMIAALAKAAQVFDEERYLEAAKRAGNFILEKSSHAGGRLYHRYREGEAAVPAFLDDYALFTWGLIELYEASFEAEYLKNAIRLTEDMLKYFWDGEKGGFYFTAHDVDSVLVREKEIYNGAIPSGNAVAMLNLLRLGRMLAKPQYEEKGAQMIRTFAGLVQKSPVAHTQFLVALDFALGPSYEVVIIGSPQAKDTKAMFKSLREKFIPNKVVLFKPAEEESVEIIGLVEFTKNLKAIEGKATAYVCQNYSCQLPTTDPVKMLGLLKT